MPDDEWMRLAYRLTLLLAAVSAGPLLFETAVALRSNREALLLQLQRFHRESAIALAREVDHTVDAKLSDIHFASNAVLYPQMDDEARRGALELIYQQTQGASIVGLFDEQGEEVLPSIYFEELDADTQRDHEPVTSAALQAYAQNIPLGSVLSSQVPAIGPPYVVKDAKQFPQPRVTLAVPVRGAQGARWVLAVEVSLRALQKRFATHEVGEGGETFLVDKGGRLMAHRDRERLLARQDFSGHPVLHGVPAGSGWLGAAARSERTGWTAVVAQPEALALKPVTRQAQVALSAMGLSLLAALILGFGAVRTVTRPLKKLRDAAVKVAAGELDAQVGLTGRDELGQLGQAFDRMTQGLRERERLRGTLSRYVSGEIAEHILKGDSETEVPGELVRVTVLFLDLRGFSTLAERRPPREVMDLLNSYFGRVVNVMEGHGGVVNKFIGDAVMAVFGAPRPIPFSELQAVRAALEIQSVVASINADRRAQGLEVAEFGVGVNTGEVLAGNVGNAQRMEYTVIGDTVNIAQRIQSHAAGGEVLISATTLAGSEGAFETESRGEVQVKGRSQAISLFRVLKASGSGGLPT